MVPMVATTLIISGLFFLLLAMIWSRDSWLNMGIKVLMLAFSVLNLLALYNMDRLVCK